MSLATDHPAAPPRQVDRGRGFIADHPLRELVDDTGPGVAVKVRLTSYRSLPLSCIERIELRIDGVAVDQADVRFLLDNTVYPLTELGRHSTVWWFILDHAELLVRTAAPLSHGEHLVEGTLTTVEPYVSNGRYHFANSGSRVLTLAGVR